MKRRDCSKENVSESRSTMQAEWKNCSHLEIECNNKDLPFVVICMNMIIKTLDVYKKC